MHFSFLIFCVLGCTFSIDVCPVDSNLLVAGGSGKKINVFDKRVSNIVKTFESVHTGKTFLYFVLIGGFFVKFGRTYYQCAMGFKRNKNSKYF